MNLPTDPNPRGFCMCGCGKPVNVYFKRFTLFGIETYNLWFHYRFAKGHYNNRKHDNSGMDPNPTGLCMCGCGAKTAVIYETGRCNGVKVYSGTHRLYLKGHHQRKTHTYTVDPETGCWIWDGATNIESGYGQLRDREANKNTYAHLYVYRKLRGPIPPGMELDHLCRRVDCVNPDHLDPVPPAINTRRNRNTKLKQEQVDEIRTLVAAGVTHKLVGERFHVTASTISSIMTGNSWRPVLPWPEPAKGSSDNAPTTDGATAGNRPVYKDLNELA